MKKEGLWLTVVLLLLLLVPVAYAEIVTIDLVKPPQSSTDFPTCNIDDGPGGGVPSRDLAFCTDGGAGASLHLDGLNTPAPRSNPGDLSKCSIGGPAFYEAKIIEFHLEKPVVGGFIEVQGGQFIECFLNQDRTNPVISRYDSKSESPPTQCAGETSNIIPAARFKYGPGDEGKNILDCHVGGTYKAFSLTKFSYNIAADNYKYACAVAHDGVTADISTVESGGIKWYNDLLDEGVACCGDEPTDSGMVVTEPGNPLENALLCYNDGGDWEWHNAESDTNAFTVKTVNKGDITSNKEQWFICDEDSVNTPLKIGSSQYGSDIWGQAAKFICVQKDDSYVYQECCVPGVTTGDTRKCKNADVTGIKRTRTPGESATSVIPGQSSKTLNIYGDILSFRTDATSAQHLEITEWLNYEKLHVVFKVSENYDIFIEMIDENNIAVFSDKLTHYLIDTPRLNEWMHAEIPFDAMPPLKAVSIRFKPEGRQSARFNNEVTIARMYLTPDGKKPLYCTGAQYNTNNIPSLWIDDLDANSNAVTGGDAQGESACNGVHATWTGTQCCGDEPGEYYSDTDGGCWNSAPLDDGDTAMTVEYSGDFTTANFQSRVEYPPQSFEWEIKSRAVLTGGNPREDALDACRAFYNTDGVHGAQCGTRCFEGTTTCYAAFAYPCNAPSGLPGNTFIDNTICDQGWAESQITLGEERFWVYQSDGSCGWFIGAQGVGQSNIVRCAETSAQGRVARGGSSTGGSSGFTFRYHDILACYDPNYGILCGAPPGFPLTNWFGQSIITREAGATDTVTAQTDKTIPVSFSSSGASTYHVTSSNPRVKVVFESTKTDTTTLIDDPLVASTEVIDIITSISPAVSIDTKSHYCEGDDCSYPITLTDPVNQHPGAYDLEKGQDHTEATRVSRQILFDASTFYSCFRSTFINPTTLGIDATDVAPPSSACTTQNNKLCSILALGWGEGVQGITEPRDTASPIQPGVNILKNPRFDEE